MNSHPYVKASSVAPEPIGTTESLFPRTAESSILANGLSEGCSVLVTGERSTHDKEYAEVPSQDQVTLNVLPDEVLLEIFYLCREAMLFQKWWWKNLADVCRRWRHIIFGSPQGLGLQIICNGRTPTKVSLDIWPQFPISIICFVWDVNDVEAEENVFAALGHHERLLEITFDGLTSHVLKRFAAEMREPLPALTYLRLASCDITAAILPGTFLGGCAPSLRSFNLYGVAFPEFPKFVFSASQLVSLRLWDMPTTGYISPEAMATCLTGLPNLEILFIGFEIQSYSLEAGRPQRMCAVLPALTFFKFRGEEAYLEDLLARLDTPLVDNIEIPQHNHLQ